MSPAREDDEEARQTRIRAWRDHLPPPGTAFPGDPRKIEQQVGAPAELTPLGRKILGADRWE